MNPLIIILLLLILPIVYICYNEYNIKTNSIDLSYQDEGKSDDTSDDEDKKIEKDKQDKIIEVEPPKIIKPKIIIKDKPKVVKRQSSAYVPKFDVLYKLLEYGIIYRKYTGNILLNSKIIKIYITLVRMSASNNYSVDNSMLEHRLDKECRLSIIKWLGKIIKVMQDRDDCFINIFVWQSGLKRIGKYNEMMHKYTNWYGDIIAKTKYKLKVLKLTKTMSEKDKSYNEKFELNFKDKIIIDMVNLSEKLFA